MSHRAGRALSAHSVPSAAESATRDDERHSDFVLVPIRFAALSVIDGITTIVTRSQSTAAAAVLWVVLDQGLGHHARKTAENLARLSLVRRLTGLAAIAEVQSESRSGCLVVAFYARKTAENLARCSGQVCHHLTTTSFTISIGEHCQGVLAFTFETP